MFQNYELAKDAYNAYADRAGWKSLATGAPLPEFDKLSAEIRMAWDAAAQAVERTTKKSTSTTCRFCGELT